MRMSKTQQALELVQERGLLRPRDLEAQGIGGRNLTRLHERGRIEKIGRGLYAPIDPNGVTEHHSLAETAKRIPGGIVCLLSALQFHQLTTQNPPDIWIAIERKARLPRTYGLMTRVVRFSGSALTFGIEQHELEGIAVRVYNPAKTVADCFKYRNKIGLEIALEALRDCWRQRKATIDQLMEAAEVCRVAKVMRPYLESLV
jgi:predicted transcriptional regulator of viral defense system